MSAHGVLLLTVRVGLCGVRSSRGWALLSISSCWQRGMPRRHSQTPQSTRTSPRYPNHSPSTNFNFFYTRSCKFNNILRAKREISKNIAFLVVTVIAAFFVNCRLEKWNLYWNANRRTPCLCLTVFSRVIFHVKQISESNFAGCNFNNFGNRDYEIFPSPTIWWTVMLKLFVLKCKIKKNILI